MLRQWPQDRLCRHGLSSTPPTRTFSGTPLNDNVGVVSVKVTATDAAGLSTSDIFDITIANSNDAPTDIALSANKIAENAAASTVVGTLSGTDPDQGDALSFSFASNPGNAFAIVDDEIVLAAGKAIVFENKKSYTLTVRVTDQGVLTYDESVVIQVTDVDEPIKGGPKNDKLFGGKADDILQRLGGNDILDGGDGADVLNGGAGKDTASYASAKAGLTANLAKPVGNTGDAAGDSYLGIENLLGSKFGDKLTGNKNTNELGGGKGNDILTGGGGSDVFVFGAKYGKDTIADFVGKGHSHDVVDLSDAAGITNFKDLIQHHVKDLGDDLQISTTDGSKLILLDTEIRELAKADFLF